MSKFFVPALFFSASAFADSGQLSAPAMTGMIDLKGILFGLGSELLPLFAILFGFWALREFFTSRYFTDRRMKAKGYERYEPFMVKRNGSYYRKSSSGSGYSQASKSEFKRELRKADMRDKYPDYESYEDGRWRD